jgi:nucleotidyltransferase substrate binding protein (TIGR01987 family)
MDYEINFQHFDYALESIKRGLEEYEKLHKIELARDGVIQRFEYTIDLAWKYIQKYLKTYEVDIFNNVRSKNDLFREAAKLNIVRDTEAWINYYKLRNETAHEYNNDKAHRVFLLIPKFIEDTTSLLKELKLAVASQK